MKFNQSLRIIAIATAVGSAAFILNTLRTYVLNSDQFFYLQQFEIHGTRYLTHRDVVALSGLSLGDQLFESSMSEVETQIRRSPYVKYVRVERRLPSTLLVMIREEEPIAFLNDGILKIISADGRILPRAIDFDYPDVPVIHLTGENAYSEGDFVHETGVRQALEFLRTCRRVSVDLFDLISEIDTTSEALDVRLIQGGAQLRFNQTDLGTQLLNFSYYLDRKNDHSFLRSVEYIDIRFQDRIIVKDRNTSSS